MGPSHTSPAGNTVLIRSSRKRGNLWRWWLAVRISSRRSGVIARALRFPGCSWISGTLVLSLNTRLYSSLAGTPLLTTITTITVFPRRKNPHHAHYLSRQGRSVQGAGPGVGLPGPYTDIQTSLTSRSLTDTLRRNLTNCVSSLVGWLLTNLRGACANTVKQALNSMKMYLALRFSYSPLQNRH